MRESDDASFVLRFDSLYASAYRVSYRLLGITQDAEEVASEALARAWVRWSKLSENPEPWIVRVAVNLSIDTLRRGASARMHLPELAFIPNHPGGALQQDSARRVDLQRALLALPRRQREVVVLRYLADLSEHEVAGQLGISIGSVKSHGARGLGALRVGLGEGRDEDV